MLEPVSCNELYEKFHEFYVAVIKYIICSITLTRADGSMRVILRDYATGDKCRATVTDGEKVYIRVVYQFTNQITQETEIRDICEELYGLILALSYYDKIKELKDMQGSGSYMLTEQDLKDIIPGDESAEVIDFGTFMP